MHLKQYQGRRGLLNPKLWITEPVAAASATEVRQLMYLREEHSQECSQVPLKVHEGPGKHKFSCRVMAPVWMQDSMQQAHTCSGNEAATLVLALTYEHLSHQHCDRKVERQRWMHKSSYRQSKS